MEDLLALAREYKDYVVPALSALGTLVVRESPRLLRWGVAACRWAGRVVYACVVRPDSEIVAGLLKAIEGGKVVEPEYHPIRIKPGEALQVLKCRVHVDAGEFSVAPACLGPTPASEHDRVYEAEIWRGPIEVTSGFTAKELRKVIAAAEARVKAVRKAADEANAAAARSLVLESLRGNG